MIRIAFVLVVLCTWSPALAQPPAAQPMLAPPPLRPPDAGAPKPPPLPAPEPTPTPQPAPTPEAAPSPAPTLLPEPLPTVPAPSPEPLPAPDQALPGPVPAPSVEPPLPPPPPTATAVPPAPFAPDSTAAPERPPVARNECLLNGLCIGPVASLGVINPFGIGAHARIGDYFGAGIDYQFMTRLTIADTHARWSLLTIEGRVYPFAGAFWLGLGVGFQSFSASRSEETEYGTVDAEGTLHIPTLKLGLGFMGRSGLVIGIDFGFNVPLGSTKLDFAFSNDVANRYEDEPAYRDAEDSIRESVQDAADAAVKLIPFIPQLNLIRIGYLF